MTADLLPLATFAVVSGIAGAYVAALAYARSLSRRLARARVRLVRAGPFVTEHECFYNPDEGDEFCTDTLEPAP